MPTPPLHRVTLRIGHADPRALNELLARLRREGFTVDVVEREQAVRQ